MKIGHGIGKYSKQLTAFSDYQPWEKSEASDDFSQLWIILR